MISVNTCSLCVNPEYCGERDRLGNLSEYPFLSITSPATNLQHLSGGDIDLNMPFDSNFYYYSTHEFHSNCDMQQCLVDNQAFATLHCNIRSLSANPYKLQVMLSELSFPFQLIGLTETKLKTDQIPLTNFDIEGYNFISQPSLSNAGGSGIYIQNNLNLRSDFSVSTSEFEALWIEVQNQTNSNIICGVLYRHHHGNLDNFIQYLNPILDKITQENKFCLIMGDFNVDLLKYESHSASDTFTNTLGSYFFQPHILQPTRITDHSATLIDNIFFNSLEHFVISGNIIADITDHLPNFLILNKFSALPSNIKLHKRNHSNFNQSHLIK